MHELTKIPFGVGHRRTFIIVVNIFKEKSDEIQTEFKLFLSSSKKYLNKILKYTASKKSCHPKMWGVGWGEAKLSILKFETFLSLSPMRFVVENWHTNSKGHLKTPLPFPHRI